MPHTIRTAPARATGPVTGPPHLPQRPPRLKITFLVHNAYTAAAGVRGTLRLAAALARHHDVTVVSVMRHRERPRLTVDPRLVLVPLVDIGEGSPDRSLAEFAAPARDFPAEDERYGQYSRLTDQRVRDWLRGPARRADVLIGTRPGLNVYLARFGPRRALRIAQEHVGPDAYGPALRRVLTRHYRTLDAVTTATRADAADHRSRTHLPGVHITTVPAVTPGPGAALPSGTAATGRTAPDGAGDCGLGPVVARYEELFAELRASRLRRTVLRRLGWAHALVDGATGGWFPAAGRERPAGGADGTAVTAGRGREPVEPLRTP